MLDRISNLFFRKNTPRQVVLKNTAWLFLGEIIGRLIRFSIVIYSARILGATEYGIFSYVLAISAFLTLFSDIGISAVLTRESVKNPEMRQQYFSTSFLLKVILLAINASILILFVPLISNVPEANALFPIIAFVFIFDSVREFGFGMNRALERMEREALIKIIMNSAVAIIGFTFILKTGTAMSLAKAYALGTGIGVLATIIILHKYFFRVFTKIRFNLIKPIIKAAWPIGLLSVLGAITLNTDMIMLGWWQTPTDIGIYAAGQKIILFLYVVPTLIASASFPAFIRLAKNNHERFKIILEKVLKATFLLSIPMFLGGLVLAKKIITLLYGLEYIPSVFSFMLLLFTLLIVFPSTILSNALFAYNEQRQFIWFVVLGALSNAVFNILLIPSFGIEGCALATIGSQLLANIFIWLKMKKINYFQVLPSLFKGIIASVLMAGLATGLILLSIHTLLIIGFSAIFYGVLLMLFKESIVKEILEIVSS